MDEILQVKLDSNFKCNCGTVYSSESFPACDVLGVLVETSSSWDSFYKCENCDQIYLNQK